MSLISSFSCDYRFACSLLRQGMKQIIINSDTPEIKSLEKMEDKSASEAVSLHFHLIFFVKMH